MLKVSDFQGLDLNNEQKSIDFDSARRINISSRINERKIREEIRFILKKSDPNKTRSRSEERRVGKECS